MKAALYFRKGYEFLLLLFFASFFPMLGSDPPLHVALRMGWGVLVALAFFLTPVEKPKSVLKSPATLLFIALLVFESVRAAAAVMQWLSPSRPYLEAPVKWFFCAGLFWIGFSFFRTRERVARLAWVAGTMSFFLALNAIPALLLRQHTGYVGSDGVVGFFHPVFYFHDFVRQYLLNRYAHPNYTGDVIALGFFPALGLFVYFGRLLLDRHRRLAEGLRPSALSLVLLGTFAASSALATVLIFSRGTILSFAPVLVIFLAGNLIKFPSKTQWTVTILGALVVVGMLIWAGKLPDVWKELQTVEREMDTSAQYSSFAANREGAKRALAIFRAYPVWGVGVGGYAANSRRFATPGTEDVYPTVLYETMCHYLHLLAEEGAGAFLYYLFILAYCLEMAAGLFRTQSRFQFTIGLAFASAVLMVLVHASINQLMQRFGMSMPVYLYMGASLALVSKDFERFP